MADHAVSARGDGALGVVVSGDVSIDGNLAREPLTAPGDVTATPRPRGSGAPSRHLRW